MIRLPKFELIAPATIQEALSFLAQHGKEARILAGGTDLLVAAKLRNCQPRYLISLNGIPELKGIAFREDEGLTMGSMTSLCRIRHDPMVLQHYPALAQAAAAVGTPQLQRMGTLGGNLCLDTRCHYYNQSASWRRHRPPCLKTGGAMCHAAPGGKRCFAVFSADTPPALMALDATVTLADRNGVRVMPLQDLYTGDGKEPISLDPGQIVTQVRLPPPDPGQASIYLKYRVRKSIDFPLAGVAARVLLDGKRVCLSTRIVLNATASAPVRVAEAERALEGDALSEERIGEAADKVQRAAHPLANAGSTPSYRRKMAGILTREALRELSLLNPKPWGEGRCEGLQGKRQMFY